MIRRLTAVAALVAAQGLVLVGTAHADASSVRVERGQLIFQAAPGQTNRVTISDDGRALVITDVAPMVPGSGCDRVSETQVSCQSAAISAIVVNLGDGDDTADINSNCANGTTVNGDSGGDTLQGGCGPDFLNGGSGLDYLFGGGGSDHLNGGPGPDELYGGQNTDFLDGGIGNDIVDGSNPDGMRDRIEYSDRAEPVRVVLKDAPDAGFAMVANAEHETDTVYNIQDILGGKNSNDLWGNSLGNLIIGGAGSNTLRGFAGNDHLLGGDNNDHLWGGDGDDTLLGGLGVDDLHGEGHVNGDGCEAGGQPGDITETCNP